MPLLANNLNAAGYAILNALIDPLTADPASPAEGRLWYNSTEKRLKYFDGTTVQSIAHLGDVGGGSGDMLAATYDPQNIAGDAFDRANHTGTQLAVTISDFNAAVAAVAAVVGALQAANNLSDVASPSAALANIGGLTQVEVDARIQLIVDTAPAALDTLNELAAALGDDPNFSATINTALGNRFDKTTEDTDAINESATRKFLRRFSEPSPLGVATVLVHNLGRTDYTYSFFETASGIEVLANVVKGQNQITVTVGTSQAAGFYTLVVTG